MKHWILSSLAVAALVTPVLSTELADIPGSAEDRHQRGVDFHLQRRLDEASREYALVLAQEPARALTADEMALVRRLAPRLFTTPSEPFPLKDAAVILHPAERLIAYHLFWDDDIDFPDDNDPCDHEVVWIKYGQNGSVERLWTYFHGRLLEGSAAAIDDARAHGQRARVNVQWGKHGSLPVGWESMPIAADPGDIEKAFIGTGKMSLLDYNRGTWRKLTTEGRRAKDHAMAKRLKWPERYAGSFETFTDFSRPVDLQAALDAKALVAVSRFNSAVINQQFLAYNFRPKTEWPIDVAPDAARRTTAVPLLAAPTLDTFQLPAKSIFDPSMPRYPNVWFYVDASLAGSYDAAVRLINDEVRGPMRLHVVPGPYTNAEGADIDVRREHLQPWEPREQRLLHHAHAFHMRYYHSRLAEHQLERVTLATSTGARPFYRVAASAHYEVEHTNPNHADVERCPYCGRTGAYASQQGNLVEKVHDPLGVELLFDGTIRGEVIQFDDDQSRPVIGLGALRTRYAVDRHVFEAANGDRNTLRIGVVVIGPLNR